MIRTPYKFFAILLNMQNNVCRGNYFLCVCVCVQLFFICAMTEKPTEWHNLCSSRGFCKSLLREQNYSTKPLQREGKLESKSILTDLLKLFIKKPSLLREDSTGLSKAVDVIDAVNAYFHRKPVFDNSSWHYTSECGTGSPNESRCNAHTSRVLVSMDVSGYFLSDELSTRQAPFSTFCP